MIYVKVKYVGEEKGQNSLEMKGINYMDKTQIVRGARISYSIWEVEGKIAFPPTLIYNSFSIFDLVKKRRLGYNKTNLGVYR